MRRLWVLLLALGVSGVWAGEASANGVTRAEVVSFLESKGLSTTIASATDAAWGTSIKTTSDGIIWRVYFPHCPNAEARCPTIQFSNSWKVEANQISFERANAWNRTKLYMKAYVSADTTAFYGEFDVVVPGACKDEILATGYARWRSQLVDFKTYFFGDVAVKPTS